MSLDHWRDLRRGQRDTILPTHSWRRRWTHRRPSWSHPTIGPPTRSEDAATKSYVDRQAR